MANIVAPAEKHWWDRANGPRHELLRLIKFRFKFNSSVCCVLFVILRCIMAKSRPSTLNGEMWFFQVQLPDAHIGFTHFQVYLYIDIPYFWLSLQSMLIRLNYDDGMVGLGRPTYFLWGWTTTNIGPRLRTRNIFFYKLYGWKNAERNLKDSSFPKSL